MWVLPTYHRAERCQRMLDSIAANDTTTDGLVIINGADPAYDNLKLPPRWTAEVLQKNVGACGALNLAFSTHADLDWYGFLSDDWLVRTPGWDRPLIEAAGRTGFAHSNDGWQSDRRMHGAIVFGGDLLRALGWWAPPNLFHCFVDDAWEHIGKALGNIRYLPDVLVEHLHPLNQKALSDDTYASAYGPHLEWDRQTYERLLKDEIPAAIARARRIVPRAPRIGLCMIVKDEAKTIRRCLDSVRPMIDYALIEDTGSTDGTQGIIRQWLADKSVSGKVVEKPWRDFGWNRSDVLAKLREIEGIDYALTIDADDMLRIEGEPEAIRRGLTADCHTLDIRHGGLRHQRPQLCKTAKPFRYRGVVHEFLDCPEPFNTAHLPGLAIEIGNGGVHRRDPAALLRDAALIEQAITDEPDLAARYTFYLAQSLRDAGATGRAIEAYARRAEMVGWVEEAYVSLLNLGRLKHQGGEKVTDVLAAYGRASTLVPGRAEALYAAAYACRMASLFHEGYALAKRGLGLAQPVGLFVEEWIYQYGLLDEFSVCAYWAGHYSESLLAAELILARANLDAETRKRVEMNRNFARARVAS